jgi:hypothetical protein
MPEVQPCRVGGLASTAHGTPAASRPPPAACLPSAPPLWGWRLLAPDDVVRWRVLDSGWRWAAGVLSRRPVVFKNGDLPIRSKLEVPAER